MKRGIWWLVLGIVVLGALAGVAIGGRPETPVDLVITGTSSSTTTETPTSSSLPPVSTTGVDVPSTTLAVASLRETANVVVANAAGQAGLASRAASILTEAGWTSVEPADATITDYVNRAYFADGFEQAARLAVADLGLTGVEFTALPERRLTADGTTGDVVVLVGDDLAS